MQCPHLTGEVQSTHQDVNTSIQTEELLYYMFSIVVMTVQYELNVSMA